MVSSGIICIYGEVLSRDLLMIVINEVAFAAHLNLWLMYFITFGDFIAGEWSENMTKLLSK